MIMLGKVFIALIWTFWLISSGSIADGAKMTPHDHSKMSIEERRAVQKAWKEEEEKPKPEYIPTYSTTYNRVIERGYVICGTNDEFPGFSEEKWTDESSNREYKNVFRLESICDFPESIKENDSFNFVIDNDKENLCAVCYAYTPTPDKSVSITVLD